MYTTFPYGLELDTIVTVTFADGSTRTDIAEIFNWATVVSYVEAE